MTLRASDIVPISEARARLTELAIDVVEEGAEKVLTKNGASYVAIVDARKLDYYHSLEHAYAGLLLREEARIGLQQVIDGQTVSNAELAQALVQRQREEQEYDAFLARKVGVARASMRADRGRSNEEVETRFAARRANTLNSAKA